MYKINHNTESNNQKWLLQNPPRYEQYSEGHTAIMPKRKVAAISSPAGTTFAPLMDKGVNVLEGLVMHKEAIDELFENELISFIQAQCERGRTGDLNKPTYLRTSGARSQGNNREMIMYGGFFDFNRARPGKRGLVPPFPPILERLVDHLISNNYLSEEVRPDSCIINQYDKGDCIPPHVDHESYYRPISTLSLLGEEPMLLGTSFRTVKSSTWVPTCGQSVPLPRRSLLVLGGNSGDVAKHCISACKGKRISITLRKQPPPDWKPAESELVGKKKSGGIGNEGADERPKKKALSGSAKRKKKMLKMMGKDTSGEYGKSNEHGSDSKISGSNHNTSGHEAKGQGKSQPASKANSETAKSAKQARRNARRLEQKKAATAASGGKP